MVEEFCTVMKRPCIELEFEHPLCSSFKGQNGVYSNG